MSYYLIEGGTITKVHMSTFKHIQDYEHTYCEYIVPDAYGKNLKEWILITDN